MAGKGETMVVIGAGILGLTAAIELQQAASRSTDILIVAREFPSDESIQYTSPWAGAHARPIPAISASDFQHNKFSAITDAILRVQSVEEPACGVVFMDGYDFLANPSEAYLNLRGGYGETEGFKLLAKDELPQGMGITFGAKYRTWSLNSPVYCAFLLRKFILRGGHTLKQTLTHAQEAFSLRPNVGTVVNCSGFGFGDPDMFPLRGQTCLVSNPCDRTITQFNPDGSWSFIIPRPLDGGTVIGGTRQPDDWTEKPSLESRARILSLAAKMYPSILNSDGKFEVIRDIVGRRPARRGGLRLETDILKGPFRGKRIIHAYGAEGHGFVISWGVAAEVVKMAFRRDARPIAPSL
ncbi:uncharacterized protein HMPREF1541_06653 [Cyphellophora europaea CBS 101466]|uniref:FAD dependent oxidoreductase domain-containing protein n=1 Tax=Cyphellophora europaea (strain CBS 101466) TaxID=1220924 RepID=W2RQ12_CYPE1|nr:uncharacterized protein HMPREF1541_06653 [Cyphellophora europaea CBS 101466]ETN38616.1 hypothetical protein HMPREF1541_06653 [Cyphellophora europaea CBS 101466]